MSPKKTFGVGIDTKHAEHDELKLIQYINLKLAALGYPTYGNEEDSEFLDIAEPLLVNYKEKARLLSSHLSPVGKRIQTWLDDYLKEVVEDRNITLPEHPFILDRHGLARMMSIPPNDDKFESDIIKSYRIKQGVLHNPKEDRRTTKGVFHVCEGGLPIAWDKKAVPKIAFVNLLEAALNPPKELMRLPFTSNQENQAELFVSLLLRPIVVPEVPGVTKEKSLEIRFFAPGNLISNLDFVESIFGNAGDPHVPDNDAALDVEGWTGHTGCVILAPHLTTLKKKDLGLPHFDDATDRQKRDSMCWKDPDELYNDGTAFKITARDERGVVVTLIADNYFGYCKKEVKTQISFSANLYGMAEEEHAGGAMAFPSYDLGEKFHLDERLPTNGMTFKEMEGMYRELMDFQPEGYAIDKKMSDIFYVPEDARFSIPNQSIAWKAGGKEQTIKLLPCKTYILPSGYKIEMKKPLEGSDWKLIGTIAEGTICHKPCTVSGGGKSEISKSISDAMIVGSTFIADFNKDLDFVDEILNKDFSDRFADKSHRPKNSRKILNPKRSLGSVIKLLTPSDEYTDDYNGWINTIPHRIKDLVYVVKRHYNPEWGENWREHFTVDRVNGALGHELKYNNKKLMGNYLRVGHDTEGSWRVFKLRQDFNAAGKVQVEDDISASTVVPTEKLPNLNPDYKNPCMKLLINCESRLFQRPDDCIYHGYDKQAELDLSSPYAFLSNYEPQVREQVQDIKDDTIGFEAFTQPVKDVINRFLEDGSPTYCGVSSKPRIWEGKPTKNPRYLQTRPDLVNPRDKYLAKVGTRLFRKIGAKDPVHMPVNAVLTGRRNNPADPKNNVPPLAVYNPIHYQELPELFIDFICSVTGKSPSTTGFGSEGALTKGPFNCLLPATDVNNSFLSFILTGFDGFSSVGGYCGPKYKVEHDISLLIPEIWCRMQVHERDPKWLIENGYLEKLDDYEHNGKTVEASLLGYRITIKFVHHFLGRIFNNPNDIFEEEMLRPELQGQDTFANSIENLVTTQRIVSENYFQDGSLELLCPPLQALVHIMRDGQFEGKDRHHPDIRAMFTREAVLSSEWYQKRLNVKQERDIAMWTRFKTNVEKFLAKKNFREAAERLNIPARLAIATKELERVSSPNYLMELQDTLGADILIPQESQQPAMTSI